MTLTLWAVHNHMTFERQAPRCLPSIITTMKCEPPEFVSDLLWQHMYNSNFLPDMLSYHICNTNYLSEAISERMHIFITARFIRYIPNSHGIGEKQSSRMDTTEFTTPILTLPVFTSWASVIHQYAWRWTWFYTLGETELERQFTEPFPDPAVQLI